MVADTELSANAAAMLVSMIRGEMLGIDTIVNQADTFGGNIVEPLVVAGDHPGEGQDEPIGIGQLPCHEDVELFVARQDVVHLALYGPQISRQDVELLVALSQAGAVVGMEDIAVPAHAHVVDDVQVKLSQTGLGSGGTA